MEETQTNHNHVDGGKDVNDSNRTVNFIVGDEEGNDNSADHNHLNGDAYEDEKEKHDNFPGDDIKPMSSGMDSKSSSYKDMFGLAERRKRLR